MKYLLDTHALVWWLYDVPQLSPAVLAIVADPDNEILTSAVSAYEIANKFRLGKWQEIAGLATSFTEIVESQGFATIAIEPSQATLAGLLQGDHRDPFDRLIAAQARLLGIPVLSVDKVFEGLGAERVW